MFFRFISYYSCIDSSTVFSLYLCVLCFDYLSKLLRIICLIGIREE